MFVTRIPRFLQGTLRSSAGELSRPQRRHLEWVLAAVLTGGVAKLKHVAKQTGCARHRTSIGRFLARSDWDEQVALQAMFKRVLPRLRKGDVIDLIIDDTRVVKRARKMADVSKLWDHTHQQFARGHIIVMAAVAVRGLTLPWALRVWQPRRSAGASYRKLTDLAAELIAAFPVPKGVRVRVLFDAAYLGPRVTKACDERGFTWYSVAAKNRRFWREDRGRVMKLNEFGPGVLKYRGRRVRMPRSFGWRWMRLAAVRGWLPRIGAAQIVFCKRPRDAWRNLLAVATNDLKPNAREVIATYERRWQIEVLFKELRELGLGAYQMQHRNGIRRHLHVVCLAHLTLTHHAVKEVGAQAKTDRRIPLPPFRTRLAAFRRGARYDQIETFTQRIRQPRIRSRVRDFLQLAA